MRNVILHYHLFKNAGTSLDAAFKTAFDDDQWITKEFDSKPIENREQVRQWIEQNKQAVCFSSHTAQLPPPQVKGVHVLPVLYMRHPIDRIASAYYFENRQGGDSFGAVLARNTDLAGYIETRLSLPNDHQCRNFHMHRLKMMFGHKIGDDFTRAKLAVERLPFIGIVENFDTSLQQLEFWLRANGFSDLSLQSRKENVSQNNNKKLTDKLDHIKNAMTESQYQLLIDSNQEDLSLYQLALDKSKLNAI